MLRELREAADAMVIEALGPDAYLLEEWSDAARAASAASRAARGRGMKGRDRRTAIRTAFTRSEGGQKAALSSFKKNERAYDHAKDRGMNTTAHYAGLRADAKGRRFMRSENNVKTMGKGLLKVNAAVTKARGWSKFA